MTKTLTPPSITATAFDCPHCGVLTTQHWYSVHAHPVTSTERVPQMFGKDDRVQIESNKDMPSDVRKKLLKWIDELIAGLVVLDQNKNGTYTYKDANNLHLSECYNCNKIAVWVHGNLLFPPSRAGALPNSDLPQDIVADFEEARSTVSVSPRGAAALMRLVVQKLCAHLGEKGKNIDDDIASLVAKGLNPLVQKALDVVRVVGNEAVHPGTIDLKDDRDTVFRLFSLVNAIAEQMITHPKSVAEMYQQLPAAKLAAIDARNEKAVNGKTS